METGEHSGKDDPTILGKDILMKATRQGEDSVNLVQDPVAVAETSMVPVEEEQSLLVVNNALLSSFSHEAMRENLEQNKHHEEPVQSDILTIQKNAEDETGKQIKTMSPKQKIRYQQDREVGQEVFEDSTFYMDHAYTCRELSNVSLDEGLGLVCSKEPPDRGFYSDGDNPNNSEPIEVDSQASGDDDNYSPKIRRSVVFPTSMDLETVTIKSMETGEHSGKDDPTILGKDILMKATRQGEDSVNLVQDPVAVAETSMVPVEEEQSLLVVNNALLSSFSHEAMRENLEQNKHHEEPVQSDILTIQKNAEDETGKQIKTMSPKQKIRYQQDREVGQEVFEDSTFYMDHAYTCRELSNVSLDEGLGLVCSKEPPDRGFYSDGDNPNNSEPIEVDSQASGDDDNYSPKIRRSVVFPTSMSAERRGGAVPCVNAMDDFGNFIQTR
ncbi:unnamed protein product [Ilex paraguariensis]|uniref:Uncharacterized protein n=1 Tax=Ilex paraguariensis TaxID=185542 RepID=A0ABC8STM2_9AQUA